MASEYAIAAEDVRLAAGRVKELARRTPVMSFSAFDERAGVRALFKCENLQLGGAFKIRGASNLILSLPPEALKRGVVAYSSGNHAQAVAIAAKYVGARATIVMPEDAPKAKLEATRSHGASIVTYNRFTENREAIAQGILERDGGLLSGSSTIAKSIHPSIRMFGAEPEAGNDTFLSLIAGQQVTVPAPDTIADGLRSPRPGNLTFPILKRYVERIALVSDAELRETVKFLLTGLKILVEPSGAAAAAAVLFRRLPAELKSVGIVLSGGNVDFADLAGY